MLRYLWRRSSSTSSALISGKLACRSFLGRTVLKCRAGCVVLRNTLYGNAVFLWFCPITSLDSCRGRLSRREVHVHGRNFRFLDISKKAGWSWASSSGRLKEPRLCLQLAFRSDGRLIVVQGRLAWPGIITSKSLRKRWRAFPCLFALTCLLRIDRQHRVVAFRGLRRLSSLCISGVGKTSLPRNSSRLSWFS